MKKMENTESQSEYSLSSNNSSISNLSIEDIEASQVGLELNIEYSNPAKKARQRMREYREKRGMPRKVDDDGEEKLSMYNAQPKEVVQMLNASTLIHILYSALNICGSRIQITDLLRFFREGYVSFFNFRKFMPDSLADSQLNMTKYHSLRYLKYVSVSQKLSTFYSVFRDIKKSLRMPNLVMLARRYVNELNLPIEIGVYVERLMEVLPSSNRYPEYDFPNYEARTMAYILLIIKLIFGIDGYREKEMSKSAQKINDKLESLNIDEKLFVYEKWREYIEYRNVLLNKYYFPSVFNRDFESTKSYELYLAMLNNSNPMTFETWHDDIKMNSYQKDHKEKNAYAQETVKKLLLLHEDEKNPMFELKFDCSFTPLKDAIEVIKNSSINSKINEKLLADCSNTSCDYYLNPRRLVELFKSKNVEIRTRKCTFPKTFCFIAAEKVINPNFKTTTYELSFDTLKETSWIKILRQKSEDEKKKNACAIIDYHNKRMSQVIKKRNEIKSEILDKKHEDGISSCSDDSDKDDEFLKEEICQVDEDEDFEMSLFEEDGGLVFIKPDFNLWHRKLEMFNNYVHSEADYSKLPRSMKWLLDAASKTIYQDQIAVYKELMALENEFVNVYKPLELNDYHLVKCGKMRIPTHLKR